MFLKLSKWSLYGAFFAPVIVLYWNFFPFIGGKYYFFRGMTELSLIFLILFWGFEAKRGELLHAVKTFFRKPLVIAVTVFVGAVLLATLFAYDSHAAFWSNYERGEGGFQMLHYYLFFLLALFLFREEREWRIAFWVACAAGALVILYGVAAAGFFSVKDAQGQVIYAFIGPYTNGDASPTFLGRLFAPAARFQGSLGNPAYVAPYLMFALFYLFFAWVRRRGTKKWWIHLGYGALAAFFFLFFILSQTRGAFLGLGVGVMVFLMYLVFSDKRFRRIGIGAFLGLILLFGILFHFRDTAFIQRIPGNRFLYSSLQEQTAQTRFWTWGSAWQGFLDRPLLGWGPENFSTVFDKYFDPRHYVPGKNTETWFDRAHSVVFDYLAETGILGFASYLGIFAVFFWEFARLKPLPHGGSPAHHKEHESRHHFGIDMSAAGRGLLLVLPIAYLIQGLAIFDVLPMYLNLFFFLALAVFTLEPHS